MNCREFNAGLWDYLDGSLPGSSRDRAAAHLAVCPDCRRRLDRAEKLLSGLRAAKAPAPAPEYLAAFWSRLREKISPRRPRILHPLYYAGLAAAAAALVLWVYLLPPERTTREGGELPVYALAAVASPPGGLDSAMDYAAGPFGREGARPGPDTDYILPRLAVREAVRLEV